MSALDRIATTFAKHDRFESPLGTDQCKCGRAVEGLTGWHAHVAEVIAADADLAVLELPKGEPAADVYGKPITDYLHQGRTVMYIDPAGPVYRGKPYSGPYNVQMKRGASGQYWTPDGAEQFAAALVATARAARAAEVAR